MKGNRIEQAVIALNERQLAAAADSHVAHIDPRALLGVTLVYLAAMLSVPVRDAGMLVWFAAYPIVSAPLAHMAYERVFRKSLFVLPLLVVIGIFNPLFDRATAFTVGGVAVSRGWVSCLSVVLRGLLSVQALLILVYVCGFNRMCEAMRRLGMPRVLVTQLLMVYRYMGVLLQETLAMHRARTARGYGKTSYGPGMWGPFVGQLLLRTLERSRRINMAMKARGFSGTFPCGAEGRWKTADTVYCLAWIPVILVMRLADLSAIMLHILRIN
ncbi:MAG: energy-coupling factor transporter transmembrane protein EcfT [Muribaculaceae bacterium]|nr:energy-coupling factor transporter transmembrane protein EcfT [Muribaculaceae bacterium]